MSYGDICREYRDECITNIERHLAARYRSTSRFTVAVTYVAAAFHRSFSRPLEPSKKLQSSSTSLLDLCDVADVVLSTLKQTSKGAAAFDNNAQRLAISMCIDFCVYLCLFVYFCFILHSCFSIVSTVGWT